MRASGELVLLAPTDLSGFLACRHRTGLDLAAARKILTRPRAEDPFAAILQRLGEEHEQRYVASLRARGLRVVAIAQGEPARDHEQESRDTRAAMRDGADVIVQARLAGDRLAGYADILRRVERPSDLGAWSYEVEDTKLARETRGGTILQLCAYSDLLARMQGAAPERFHVVAPGDDEQGDGRAAGPAPAIVTSYRVEDYAAYYRLVLASLEEAVAGGHEALLDAYYPEPVEHCAVCAWDARCVGRRRRDDHLSFVANTSRVQRLELVAQGHPTLAAAAAMPVPVTFRPVRGSRETYDRIGGQARVQRDQREQGRPVYERLPVADGEGLCGLPEPSPGDLFLDLEGARFARTGGREYLFGVVSLGAGTAGETPAGVPGAASEYRAWWAADDREEREAFEAVMDVIMDAWARDPGMHVYHFNHYEPTAFKKLAGRHVTRGDALDRLLRGRRFVDLYPITRQAVRAGVESYSIKKLEPFSRYTRRVPLADVSQALMDVERLLESTGAAAAIPPDIGALVQGYNEDDCRSTVALRIWLESLRGEWAAEGTPVPRPAAEADEASPAVAALQQEAAAIRARLLEGLTADAANADHPDHARWLLAYLVDFHKREDNAQWWEYFRLVELAEDELVDERKAIAGLTFGSRVDVVRNRRTQKPTGSVIDRYAFPPQDVEIRRKETLKLQDGRTLGDVVAFDREARTVDVRKGPSMADVHPPAVFAFEVVQATGAQKAVMRLAERLLAGDASPACGIELLHRRPPRLRAGEWPAQEGESAQDLAVRVATTLDRTTLAIQGPPGSGKTHIGADMIRALVRAGRRVGVTATSHAVIRNLLEAVRQHAAEAGETIRLAHKVGDADEAQDDEGIAALTDNEAPRARLAAREVDVVGGTAWLWAREEYADTVDVLVVDEAGQMSLATALAVSQAADSLVLLGDPQQLDQPQQGSHPDGVGVSALEHVLGGAGTMPVDRGIFLPMTHRMSPAICAFTSEVFYGGRLGAMPALAAQVLQGVGRYDGSGLWLVPVEHDGNQGASDEEVAAVAALVDTLLAPGAAWVDQDGAAHPMTADEIRVVAPFNAQVNRLADRLARAGGRTEELGDAAAGRIPVGTVDRFQGQTAAVVIYSMATSRPEDAPRGMGFLYSLNRLNVATSRARCAVFVVCSPRLLEPECRTPDQIRLANALCRYRELARL